MPATQPVATIAAARDAMSTLVAQLLTIPEPCPAKFFVENGIRGKVGESCRCPLAEWLTRDLEAELEGSVHVSVGSTRVTVTYRGVKTEVPLPPAFVQFVRDFDEGLMPNLIG